MRNVPFYYWALFSRSHTCKLRRSWLQPKAEDVWAFGQHTFRDATNSFPAKTSLAPRKKIEAWERGSEKTSEDCLRNEFRNSTLMTCHGISGSASDWLKQTFDQEQALYKSRGSDTS